MKHNKDNAIDERFNRTVIEEFMETDEYFEPYLTETSLTKANERLTEWLVFYNFKRPHEALDYQTPMKASHLSPMYSSCTCYWLFSFFTLNYFVSSLSIAHKLVPELLIFLMIR